MRHQRWFALLALAALLLPITVTADGARTATPVDEDTFISWLSSERWAPGPTTPEAWVTVRVRCQIQCPWGVVGYRNAIAVCKNFATGCAMAKANIDLIISRDFAGQHCYKRHCWCTPG